MKKTSFISRAALIAAIYAVLTLAFPYIGFGVVQVRISEALCVLPFFMPEAVCGLTVGCLAANLVGCFMGMTAPWDILIGTFATLSAAFISSKIKHPALVPLPAVVLNAVLVSLMLTYIMIPDGSFVLFLWNAASVGTGQVIACYGLGMPLFGLVRKIMRRNEKCE